MKQREAAQMPGGSEPQKWGITMSEQNDKVTCPYCGAAVRITGTSRAVLCPVCKRSFAKPTMQKKATDLFRDGETDKEFRDAMKKVTKEAGFEEYDENAKNVGVDDERKEKLLSQLKENREELHRSSVEDKAAGGMNRLALIAGIIAAAVVIILLIVLL